MIENKKLNYELISLARDYKGITQKELANLIWVEQGTLSKIENDILPVYQNDPLAQNISDKLGFPIKFFLQNLRIYAFDVGSHARKRQAVNLNKGLIAKLNLIRSNIELLLKSVEIPQSNIPNIPCDNNNSPRDIANKTRKFLKIGDGAVNNISRILEDNGCIIYQDDLDIEGFSFCSGNHHIICINKNAPIDRIRFTQAHELGHLVMHRNQLSSKELEQEANNFASEFLMPSHLIKEDFANNDIYKIHDFANLKLKWKTSIKSIIRKAYDLGFIGDREYKNLQVQISRYGYRKNEPYELDRSIETPSLLKEIFNEHFESLRYNLDQISDTFSLYKEEVIAIYKDSLSDLYLRDKEFKKPYLRLV